MDDTARTVWIVLVLVMVASSLVARRMPLVRLVTWSAAWAALFLGVYIMFTLIEPQIATWQQAHRGGDVTAAPGANAANMGGSPQANLSGAGVTIPMQADGHYWVDASVNGQTVRFLVDSGASITAVAQSTADRLGLAPDPMGRTMVMQTANGAMTAARSTIPVMAIGTIQASELPVVVSATFGDTNVLGMNFLNKLKSWRVEDGNMVLEPR
ncbi:MAG TPA: TIGR02281 family clan AA aspartic protease [Sphingobium sp.]